MKPKLRIQVLLLAMTTAFAGSALAAVSAEEAKQLGGPVLTAFGSEKAGNKEGTIPAYTGERTKAPASYDPKEPRRIPSPWNDKPLFSITAQNVSQYADKLSEGQKALFKKYPGYRMDIYPSRRTMVYPKYALDNTLKNATSCKGANASELRIEGCLGGVVFPIPKTGNQVMWNHNAAFTSVALDQFVRSWLVTPDGKPVLLTDWHNWQESPFSDPKAKVPGDPSSTLYFKLLASSIGPARKFGEKFIILNPLDPINPGQRAWSYIPGQRRVKLAPDLAYDTPSIGGGGQSTMDENFVFMGGLDRYDFKLLGKKEMFIVYNAYDLNDYKVCPESKLFTKNYPNPDCIRWELHRTWQVDAKLKPGFRHIYPRRVMYFDEDVASAGMSDQYDASGTLYRFNANYPFLNYTSPRDGAVFFGGTFVVDLLTGGWTASTLMNYPGGGLLETEPKPDTFFSPETLAGEGIR